MSTNLDQQTEIDRPASSGAFLERMANRVGINSKVTAGFGDPVEREGVTVIPVAKVWWGFGGGAGTGRDASQNQSGEETGGGGGSRDGSMGYLELKDSAPRVTPLYDPDS